MNFNADANKILMATSTAIRNDFAIVAGWGAINIINDEEEPPKMANIAQKMRVKIESKVECEELYQTELSDSIHICAVPEFSHQATTIVSIFQFIKKI